MVYILRINSAFLVYFGILFSKARLNKPIDEY